MSKKTYNKPKNGFVYVLSTCRWNGDSHNGFQWPESGGIECADGNWLHGLLWGAGAHPLLDWDAEANWVVVKVAESDIVYTDEGKAVKFPRGTVEFYGDRSGALDFIKDKGADPDQLCCQQASAGDGGQASAGYRGQASVGERGKASAGERGQASAGLFGQASAGDYGQALAGNNGQALAGERGQAFVGALGKAWAGNYGHASAGLFGQASAGLFGKASAGAHGQASVGACGQASAGEQGIVILRWYDQTLERWRVSVGYVGENGIKPDTWYRADNEGKLIEVGPVEPKEGEDNP